MCNQSRSLQLAAVLLAAIASAAPALGAVDPGETRRAQALFERHWNETARLAPEWATYRGDHRYGDRLSDRSPEGIAAAEGYWRDLLGRARTLNRSKLAPQDRISADLLQRLASDELEMQPFRGFRSMTVNGSSFPFQAAFAGLLRISPAETTAQLEQVLKRMAAYPRRVSQEIEQLRAGIRLGWVAPRPALEQALRQLDVQLATEAAKSPYYDPFARMGSAIPAAEQQALRARAIDAISTQVMPALRSLREFVAAEYLPSAPPEGSLTLYPGGDRVYASLVRIHTTTALTPQQIHDIGLREVGRLRAEMESVMRGTGFQGDFAAFVKFLRSDPKFFYASGEELLAGYRDIAKRIDPELPRLFAELPRAPYGVRAMPAFMGPGAAENYNGPGIDGTRPGWFNANALGYQTRPKWTMEALVAHEAVPGHHLQSARAVELKGLPAFRRASWYTAYGEGWALYAETLGDQLGLYKDPHSKFGQLQFQIWRAGRLVVDTGIHAFGWSRQRAIDYLLERTGMDEVVVTSEVDRYTANPGQALGYMIGQIKIIELRDRARTALGRHFDLRRFHNAVLDNGPVPLDVLERLIEEWIGAVRAEGRSGREKQKP